MADCCSKQITGKYHQICPQCGAECISVEMRTLFHHVKYPENQSLEMSEYYFCASNECRVGYFSSDITIAKQGICACEIRNPTGRCCLADFKQLEISIKNLEVVDF